LNKKFNEEFKTVLMGLQRTTQNRNYGIWHELQSFTLSSIVKKRKRFNSKHRQNLKDANLGKSRSICKNGRNTRSLSKSKKLETIEQFLVKNELRKKSIYKKKSQTSKSSRNSVLIIQNINEKLFYKLDYIRRRTTHHSVKNIQVLKRRYTIK
jgi:hypothetical protein